MIRSLQREEVDSRPERRPSKCSTSFSDNDIREVNTRKSDHFGKSTCLDHFSKVSHEHFVVLVLVEGMRVQLKDDRNRKGEITKVKGDLFTVHSLFCWTVKNNRWWRCSQKMLCIRHREKCFSPYSQPQFSIFLDIVLRNINKTLS